jgi:DNA polymerase type B, organellar and viral
VTTRPSYGTEARRLYQAAYRAAGRDNTCIAGANRMRDFVGVDGEGGDTDDQYHAYFLLSTGDVSLSPSKGNVRLSTRECLAHLADLPADRIYVVYFGDYDVTKILEDLPFHSLDRLMNRNLRRRKDGHGYFPVDYGEFEIEYFPRKEFKVRRKDSHWITINDVGSFFQCRFTKALDDWDIGTAEQRDAIGAGKDLRGTFQIGEIDDIRRYNLLEIELLQRLMDKFRASCIDVGIVPAKWQGPGQLAEALFRKYAVPASKNVPLLSDPAYAGLMTFARNSFYGGRPELSVIGPVTEPCYQWDINSAYPYAMKYVPCLLHGKWEYEESSEAAGIQDRYDGGVEAAKTGEISLCFGSFDMDSGSGEKPPLFYGFPFRSKQGTITYPAEGRGWYWSFEIAESVHQRFVTESRWTYTKQCECQPLAFVEDIYAERLRIGKDGPGYILKLALNSLYGKTAQSVGMPKYANPVWASFITAFCRAMIQQFIHSSDWCGVWCGRDVQMIATDSVCTTSDRTGLSRSTTLGGWSVETHSTGIFFVQPGVYFGSSGKPAKTRGVPRVVMEEMRPEFLAAFERMTESKHFEDGDVRVPQTMFVGIKYALHRKNMKLLGQWISFADPETGVTGKRMSFEWTSKRAPYPVLSPTKDRPYLLTFPKDGDVTSETMPYNKDIGGIRQAEEIRSWYTAQPDWADDLTTDELG